MAFFCVTCKSLCNNYLTIFRVGVFLTLKIHKTLTIIRLSVAHPVSSKLGSGMARMDQACKAKNIPEPYYEVRPGGVAIVFRFKYINDGRDSNQNCELDCELDCELKLTDRQKVILSILMSDGEKTASWIASQLEVGLRSEH